MIDRKGLEMFEGMKRLFSKQAVTYVCLTIEEENVSAEFPTKFAIQVSAVHGVSSGSNVLAEFPTEFGRQVSAIHGASLGCEAIKILTEESKGEASESGRDST